MNDLRKYRGFIEVTPGAVIDVLNKQQCEVIRLGWKKQYAPRAEGMRLSQNLWHVFSHGGFPSVNGLAADDAYQSELSDKYVVMDDQMTAGLVTDQRPDNLAYHDVHVFPLNLAWTMAFTHEDGNLGPYFARHEKYEALSAENAAQLEKQQQIRRARENGWL